MNSDINTFPKLEDDVINWAIDKGIIANSDYRIQALKVVEELGEFIGCLAKNNLKDAAGELGDVLVTLIITAEMCGLDLTDCLSIAYNKINTRAGKLVNGVFVKSTDVKNEL